MSLDLARTLTLSAATFTTGLMAGLFFAYTNSVMPGLGAGSDRTFVEAMRRIDTAIQNGWFLLCFIGALVCTIAAVAVHIPGAGRAALPWLLVALVLYIAVLVVTGVVNVPLNNALHAAGDTDVAAARAAFEAKWITWNNVRTAANTGAFAALIVAWIAR